jgi:HlyD family secretion protein
MVLLAGILGLAYWSTSRPKVIDVLVKPVELGLVERTVANTRAGTVTACARSYPTPSIGGQIARILVKEGDKVKKGDLLLELWNELHQAEVSLAASQILESESTARSVCLQAEVAQREADRLVSLQKRGSASADQTDKAVTDAQARDAQCAAARGAVEVNRGRQAVAQAKLNQTLLLAPFDGVVAKINGELLEYVTPSPPGIATLPIIDLVGVGCFFVAAPIDEVDSREVQSNLPARITIDAFSGTVFEGIVRRVAPFVQALEKQARTVDVEVEFTNEDDLAVMLAGYSADIEIILETREDVVRVPTEAVVEGGRLFVLDPNSGSLHERKVEVGISNWDYTQIVDGVMPGELVVTSVDRAGIAQGALARPEALVP